MLFGYAVTAIVLFSFFALVFSIILGRKELKGVLKPFVNRYSLLLVALAILFFIIFSALYVSPVERLYFDESIYQGIALNILHNGNALWCQYGSAYLTFCGVNQIYHDPVGWSVFIGIAFFLFGTGTGTAYGLQLLVGALTILGVFLLTGVLFQRKDIAVLAAAVMALNPQLFVWSRTQAVMDLPFMMLTLFSFFFFVVALRRNRISTYAMAAFSLVITFYTRIEAFVILPIFLILFFVFGDSGIRATAKAKAKSLFKKFHLGSNFTILALFILLIVPQLIYITMQSQSGDYGQTTGSGLLSISNFEGNIVPNLQFFFGFLTNTYPYFPTVFLVEITALAIVGMVLFAFDKRYKNRFGITMVLLLWILLFHLFYDFFYAGSVLYGVDARFMLEIMPPLAVAAGLGIFELATLIVVCASRLLKKGKKSKKGLPVYILPCISVVLFALLIGYPFVTIIHYLTLPADQLPQETVDLGAINFIYENYNAVPANCLVFSFTPDVWYALNRSSAQIGELGSSDANFTAFASHYSCFVLDYGYWCQIPPFRGSTCSSALQDYNVTPILSQGNSTGNGVGFYRLNNYTP